MAWFGAFETGGISAIVGRKWLVWFGAVGVGELTFSGDEIPSALSQNFKVGLGLILGLAETETKFVRPKMKGALSAAPHS